MLRLFASSLRPYVWDSETWEGEKRCDYEQPDSDEEDHKGDWDRLFAIKVRR